MFYRQNIIARSFQTIDGALIDYIDSPDEKSDNSVAWLHEVDYFMEKAVAIADMQTNHFGPRQSPVTVNHGLRSMCRHLRNAQLCLAYAMLDISVQEALEICQAQRRFQKKEI